MKEQFIDNINDILDNKQIEGISLERVDLLKSVLQDQKLFNKLYRNFNNYFIDNFNEDELYLKTEDFVYRLHYAINHWLIPIHHINDSDVIKTLHNLVDNGINLYESVSYDEYDKTMLDEFEEIYHGKEYNI